MTKDSPVIISFIGPVGVGKSTQIRLIASYFRSKGRKTVETYIKSAHGSTYVLSVLIKKLSDLTRGESDAQAVRSRRDLQVRFAPLWNISETVSIVGKFLLSVYLPFNLGFNVLIEEGLIMSIENYSSFRPQVLGVKASELPLLDVFLRWVNFRKHMYVVLDAGDEDAAARRRSRSFRREEREDYVKLQRAVMSKLNGPDVLVVETSGKSIKEVNRILIEHLVENHY
jgi:cytidylate kinase